jgi:hypothetical protein
MQFPNLENFSQFKTKEPMYDQYLPNLQELLKIIKAIGEPLEGNIFYKHFDPNPGEQLSEKFLPKRAALSMFAMAHNNIVEVGFNAGFSALVMLTANPTLKLTSVDICTHKYTEPCFDYLASVFPGRITLVKGNSTEVLADVLQNDKALTGYIIDGGHGLAVAETDLQNVIQYANSKAVLCFDDSDFVELRLLLNAYMMAGYIVPITDVHCVVQDQTQMFFKIVA